MALLLKTDGTEEIVKPANRKFTMTEMYQLLKCDTVQMIGLPGGETMWMDEDGKRKTNVININASRVLHAAGGLPRDMVVGTVLICDRGEVA